MITPEHIKAMISLLDDPDQEVFEHVSTKLLDLGSDVIRELESAWETNLDPVFQQRVEELIHRIQSEKLEVEFADWLQNEPDNLLRAVLLFNRVGFQDINTEELSVQLEEIRRNLWIEFNPYLTPLEEVNIFRQIIYNHYKFSGNPKQSQDARYTYLSILLETKKGNPFSLGMLYLILAQMHDLPVYGVCLPHNFILAVMREKIEDFTNQDQLRADIVFYINPFNKGMVFTAKEIERYLTKINLNTNPEYYLPSSNEMVVKEMMRYQQNLYKKAGAPEKSMQIAGLLQLFDRQ